MPTHPWLRAGLQARIESRPPVAKDISGPTPCSYTLRAPYKGPATKIGPPVKYPRGEKC